MKSPRGAVSRVQLAQQGRKVFKLQTLSERDPADQFTDVVGKVAGSSLHAGVATSAHERKKLKRLCRYLSANRALRVQSASQVVGMV